jgi:hypothetical protein
MVPVNGSSWSHPKDSNRRGMENRHKIQLDSQKDLAVIIRDVKKFEKNQRFEAFTFLLRKGTSHLKSNNNNSNKLRSLFVVLKELGTTTYDSWARHFCHCHSSLSGN